MSETLDGTTPVVGSDPWWVSRSMWPQSPRRLLPCVLSPVTSSPCPQLASLLHRDHPGGAAAGLRGQRLLDGHGAHQQHEAALPGPHLHTHGHLHRYVPAPEPGQSKTFPGQKAHLPRARMI